jgi:hypothetical protein
MSLPVIKAKTYNYGSYANPQQVRFKQEFGASLGETVGKAVERVAEAKAQDMLEEKNFNKNADTWQVTATTQLNKFLPENATAEARKEIALAVDNLRPERGDTVDDKIKKQLALEDMLTNLRLMKKTEELEIDSTSSNIASSSKADAINGELASNGRYIPKWNKENMELEFLIPEVKPYSGSAIPNISIQRIDPTTFVEKISNLNQTYDSELIANELKLNDPVKTPNLLKALYINKKEEFSPLTREVEQPDGSKDVYFDKALVKDYFLKPGSEMGKYIQGVVDKQGQTIWEDTLGKKGFDKNNSEHISEIKNVVASDIANKYGQYRIGSIAKTVQTPTSLTSTGITQQGIQKDSKYFQNQLLSSLASYDKTNDITALLDFFKGKKYDGKEIIGFTMGPEQGRYVIGLEYKSGQTGIDSTPNIDLSNKVEFDNLIDQLFPGVGNYNTGMRRAIKNMVFFVDKEDILNPNK